LQQRGDDLSAPQPPTERTSFPLQVARLLRLPNVFTALSNVAMGYFFVVPPVHLARDWPVLALLLTATAGLYLSGMVLNDLFDVEVDRLERPERPLPSGAVSLSLARGLGWGLWFLGLAAGVAAGMVASETLAPNWLSGAVATLLAFCVLLYNGVLKHTWLGPVAMGSCRMLNVLLGMSVPVLELDGPGWAQFAASQWLVAGGLGLYVTGVTWFARSEAGQSHRGPLLLGCTLLTAGLCSLASLPWFREVRGAAFRQQPLYVVLFFGLFGFPIVRRVVAAIFNPSPQLVQGAVKHALLSIIVLDAAVTLLVAPPGCGLAIAALLLPAMLLGRWVYST
jgi:4-hydroxybenzoate polyprenyltransferase